MTSINDTNDLKVGFFGGGMMAEAIIRGILSKGAVKASNISVSEPSESRQQILSDLGLFVTSNGDDMLSRSDIVFIAVKPHIVPVILKSISVADNSANEKIYVSICAGVTIDTLLDGKLDRKVIRVMPNQPCLVGEAVSAMSASSSCTSSDKNTVEVLLGACGIVEHLPESALDAVTGLSGSGPGFVFMMIEAMSDAGVKNGLARPIAQRLATQTVLGAAKMASNSPGIHPAEFRNRVESPGGTTITGTSALEEHGFRAAIISAVTAATNRSKELGRK